MNEPGDHPLWRAVMNARDPMAGKFADWPSTYRYAFLCGWEQETVGTKHPDVMAKHPRPYKRGQHEAAQMKAAKQKWS